MILLGALLAFASAVAFASLLGAGAPPAGADGACANEAIRIAQRATQVGGCRAFERVTPADKGGGDIVAENGGITAGADGNAAAFESRIGFADSEGSGAQGRITYFSERGAAGWTTHALTPRGNPDANLVRVGTYTEVFSEDMSHVLTRAYDLPDAVDDTPDRMNLYIEDTADRKLQSVTGSQTGEGDPIKYFFGNFLAEEGWGNSPDLHHLSFAATGQLVPAIPGEYPNASKNAYSWDEGTIHLAGILPDGTVPPGGSTLEPESYRGGISVDGSRLPFSAPAFGPKQVFLRVDDSYTVLVSESENPAFAEEAQNVHFEGMTPDGETLFFTTESPLLPGDTAGGPDLYRWTFGPDPEHEPNLTLLTNSGSAITSFDGTTGALVGMSDDGTRVYTKENNGDLRVLEAGTSTFIRSVAEEAYKSRVLRLASANPGYSRVSPDGKWLAYVAGGQLFLYNHDAGTVTCTTCPGELFQFREEAAYVPTLTASGGVEPPGFRSRYLTDDGRVFFTTANSLLPQDTNGVPDVYSYDGPTGQLSLVSSGVSSEPSEFADASKSGDDVFFVTRSRLVPSDSDDFIDLYDSRVGGGFDEPRGTPVGPCSGEACQGGSAASPLGPSVASGAVARGNLRPRRPCGKNQRHLKRHGKVRCVKRKKHRAGRKRESSARLGTSR